MGIGGVCYRGAAVGGGAGGSDKACTGDGRMPCREYGGNSCGYGLLNLTGICHCDTCDYKFTPKEGLGTIWRCPGHHIPTLPAMAMLSQSYFPGCKRYVAGPLSILNVCAMRGVSCRRWENSHRRAVPIKIGRGCRSPPTGSRYDIASSKAMGSPSWEMGAGSCRVGRSVVQPPSAYESGHPHR